MTSVLLVSNTNTTLQLLSSFMTEQSISRLVTSTDGASARREILDTDFDLIIIDSPLKDELGVNFALDAADKTTSGIIYVTKYENLYDANEELEDGGVFVLPKPISPELFYQAIRLLTASRRRVLKLEEENNKLQNKIEEIKLVNRAKCVLIQYLSMSEDQAHRHIEKQAMDLRVSRKKVAERILIRYES
ncbi:MAG: response regulator receiver protein [Treponema sp. CETP13]|nr:MAG: response regulator receiver protein [Treponema sp. CETP13]